MTPIPGFKQEQLDLTCGDDATKVPQALQRPNDWPCAGE